ncbi:VapC toxin protein [Olavius sp. associated proteobacterium Delta 1]|nr:VapC toxin protein [Olavius sp. associated proteobacterium Delta 1]
MNYLLDTCVISEMIKPKPSSKVIKWLRSCRDESLFLSSLTVGEIQKGISKLPNSRKKNNLQEWMDKELIRRFDKRILGIDFKAAQKWGKIQASSELTGTKMPVIDSLIASIGIVHDMTVVTRDTGGMKNSGVRLFNPWK